MIESDIGTFRPLGLTFSGQNDQAQCTMHSALKLLSPINATQLFLEPDGSDVLGFISKGVPGSSLKTDDEKYFYFHHTDADTMTVENSDELDLCTAVFASISFVFSDIDSKLPR